jgi:hypothetical protein
MPLPYLHTDVVFHPNWWNKNYGLAFDRGFFYDPTRRVNQEKQMRELLYERFGDLGLGCRNAPRRPLIGPVILGSGYFIIDHGTPDEAIRAMFETVARYRGDRENPIPRAYEVA